MFKIRHAKIEDLPEIDVIEHLCFPIADAAAIEILEKRIQCISDSFFVAEENGVIIGFVNGPVIESNFITDDLFSDVRANPASGGHQSILGLAVTPHFQTRGVASALLAHIENEARKNQRKSITLTCKENLIQFYENYGYINKGVSNSELGGAIWYNMIKMLP